LLQTIGEEMPARVAKNLSSDDKRRLKQMMEAGVDYGLHVAPAEWAARFPRMAAALSPVRISLASLSVVSVLIFVGLLAIRRRLQLRHVDV
jgi:hypothetical protein